MHLPENTHYYYAQFSTAEEVKANTAAVHPIQALVGYEMIKPYYRAYFSMYSSNTSRVVIGGGDSSDINMTRQRSDAEYTTIILLTTSSIFSSITWYSSELITNSMRRGYFFSGNANALAVADCYIDHILIKSLISGHEVKNVYMYEYVPISVT